MTNTRPNLAYFIFTDLVHCIRGCTSILHGMVLSFYLEAQSLDLFCDPDIVITKHRYIGRKSVSLVGYEVQDDNFVPKPHRQRCHPAPAPKDAAVADEQQQSQHPDTHGGDDTERTSSIPTIPGPSSAAKFDARMLYESIIGRFDVLDQRFDHFTARFGDIDARLTSLERSHQDLSDMVRHMTGAPFVGPSTTPPTNDPPADDPPVDDA